MLSLARSFSYFIDSEDRGTIHSCLITANVIAHEAHLEDNVNLGSPLWFMQFQAQIYASAITSSILVLKICFLKFAVPFKFSYLVTVG